LREFFETLSSESETVYNAVPNQNLDSIPNDKGARTDFTILFYYQKPCPFYEKIMFDI
jgi:hypothetical protein